MAAEQICHRDQQLTDDCADDAQLIRSDVGHSQAKAQRVVKYVLLGVGALCQVLCVDRSECVDLAGIASRLGDGGV